MLAKTSAQDIVYTPAVSGIPANFIKESLLKAGYNLEAGAEIKKLSMAEEAKAWRDVWSAGHGVKNIEATLSVKDLVTQLVSEYNEALGDLKRI
jgi:nitronate monooxygenase